jgi:ketosteroid isomerase-like protein
MSQENVEVVRRIQRAFNEGDVEAIVSQLHPAVEWEEPLIPGAEQIYRGHEGVRRWAKVVFGEGLGALQAHGEGFTEAGDAVIAATRIEGEGRSSRVRVQMSVHLVLTFKDGKVVRRQVFQSGGEALEALRRSE